MSFSVCLPLLCLLRLLVRGFRDHSSAAAGQSRRAKPSYKAGRQQATSRPKVSRSHEIWQQKKQTCEYACCLRGFASAFSHFGIHKMPCCGWKWQRSRVVARHLPTCSSHGYAPPFGVRALRLLAQFSRLFARRLCKSCGSRRRNRNWSRNSTMRKSTESWSTLSIRNSNPTNICLTLSTIVWTSKRSWSG